jgi:ATP-binding cassette subfamily B protein
MVHGSVACSILNKIFDLAPPALIGAAVDVVVQQQDSAIARFGVKDVFSQLVVLSVLSFVIWGLEFDRFSKSASTTLRRC